MAALLHGAGRQADYHAPDYRPICMPFSLSYYAEASMLSWTRRADASADDISRGGAKVSAFSILLYAE